jgi:hypothetical protein
MSSTEWLQRVARFVTEAVASEANESESARHRSRLALEVMEERAVPAVFTVTNLADSGAGTLREAILSAESTSESDTIQFGPNVSGTINLSTIGDISKGAAAFGINTSITIDGLNGSSGVTISRDGDADKMRLFTIGNGGSLTLQGVTLQGGLAQGARTDSNPSGIGAGGAIYNEGRLSVRGVSFIDNDAIGAPAIPGAQPDSGDGEEVVIQVVPSNALGGAIFNDDGAVSVQGSTFSGNRAVAGTPITGGTAAQAFGGGIANLNGSVTIQNSTLTLNEAASGGRQVYSIADGDTASLTINGSILGQGDVNVSDLVATAVNGGRNNASGGTNLIRAASGFKGNLTLTEDPLLGDLGDNGGPTRTHAPLEDSPVIDVGTETTGVISDQRGRGFARVSNRIADLGSVEIQSERESTPIATGTGIGAPPHVLVLDQAGNVKMSFYAYDPLFGGGVNVALGDVNSDGTIDVITTPKIGPGHIKAFDGVTGAELYSFYAFDPAVVTEFQISSGDVNADGFDDMVISIASSGPAHVRAFSGETGEELHSFYAFAPEFLGGATLAVSDMNSDGFADIIVGAGLGGPPHIRVVSGEDGAELASFYALDARMTTGVTVATGDLNGDGQEDFIITPRVESNGVVIALDGGTRQQLKAFALFEGGLGDGLSVTARDLSGDGVDDLIVGPPSGFPGQIRLFDGASQELIGLLEPYTVLMSAGISLG